MIIKVVLKRTLHNEAVRPYVHLLVSLLVGFIVGFCLSKLLALSSVYRQEWIPHAKHNLTRSEEVVYPHVHSNENSTIATKLFNETRILCWIMTDPKQHSNQVSHVKRTWGKRCNKLLFISSSLERDSGFIALNISEKANSSWAKTMAAFSYVYEHHFDEADWFLKAEDNTYVILENLRYMLYPYSPKTPIYFGCKLKSFVKQGFMTYGAGFVLSKEALRRLIVNGFPNIKLCNDSLLGGEDAKIGKCLENVNVTAGDSRDEYKRGRFFPFNPEFLLIPSNKNKNSWYWKNVYYSAREGLNCCSDYAISFHKIPPMEMLVMEYFIYHVRPFGVIRQHAEL